MILNNVDDMIVAGVPWNSFPEYLYYAWVKIPRKREVTSPGIDAESAEELI